MSILDQIDRVTSGLCPCGAEPAEGSAYCSDDCRPSHISRDTDTRESGHLATSMRWRPDLVTDLHDSDLIPVDAPRTGYTGRFNATAFRRRSNPDMLHLRLDDSHRLVGLDVAEVADERGRISSEAVERVVATWRRLERELADPRHAVPEGDPWAGVWGMTEETRTRLCDWLRANNLDPDRMPEDARITVTVDEIEAEVCVTDAAGDVVLNGSGETQRTTRRVPLIEPVPVGVSYCNLIDQTRVSRPDPNGTATFAPVGTYPNDPAAWINLSGCTTDDGLTWRPSPLATLAGIPIILDDTIPAGIVHVCHSDNMLMIRARNTHFTLSNEQQETIRAHFADINRRADEAMRWFEEHVAPILGT